MSLRLVMHILVVFVSCLGFYIAAGCSGGGILFSHFPSQYLSCANISSPTGEPSWS